MKIIKNKAEILKVYGNQHMFAADPFHPHENMDIFGWPLNRILTLFP